ncbi:MAG: PD-(D/E)XK nuclease family protein, partial [Planctomycetes bacterium]|nr:PD-(D/E)XK nuclease family protein [Planctomycetota bacterium]
RLLAWRDAARRRDFETLFVRILDESGVLRRELFVRENERKLTNYLHICELLLEECGRRGRELAGVIGALESYIRGEAEPPGDESTQQRLETDRLSVQVMTMHKAKGLEAPVVFLYGGYGASPPGDLHVFHRDDDLDAPRVMAVEPLDEGARERWQRDEREEEERLLYVAITRAAARLYLPWIADRALRSFVGGYRILNDRLNAFAEDEANAVHFERITVPALEAGAAEMAAEAPVPVAWMPPPEVLEEARPAALDFAALARAHAAIVVSSYSRMKRAARGERTAAPEIAAEAGGKEVLEDEPTSAPDAEAEDVLPGGTATGSFLHEVLERVDLAPVRGSTLADWSARPEVEALFRAAMARHDRDPRHLPHARRLVHTALTADLALGDARLAGGIAALDPARVRREMEFLYPIPEAGHPRLGAPLPAAGFTVERGYLRGFVDLVFEHDGRVYFADWKTDLLPEYTASTLAEHVERNYDLQVKVYAVAMARWLGLGGADNAGRRFGGILYCFVRGMEAPGSGAEGVHFRRPDRAELEGYARELREFAHYRETHHGA